MYFSFCWSFIRETITGGIAIVVNLLYRITCKYEKFSSMLYIYIYIIDILYLYH